MAKYSERGRALKIFDEKEEERIFTAGEFKQPSGKIIFLVIALLLMILAAIYYFLYVFVMR